MDNSHLFRLFNLEKSGWGMMRYTGSGSEPLLVTLRIHVCLPDAQVLSTLNHGIVAGGTSDGMLTRSEWTW